MKISHLPGVTSRSSGVVCKTNWVLYRNGEKKRAESERSQRWSIDLSKINSISERHKSFYSNNRQQENNWVMMFVSTNNRQSTAWSGGERAAAELCECFWLPEAQIWRQSHTARFPLKGQRAPAQRPFSIDAGDAGKWIPAGKVLSCSGPIWLL